MINPYLTIGISIFATIFVLYILKLTWSVLLYGSQLLQYKYPANSNKINISSTGGQHHIFYLGGYRQFNYHEMHTSIDNTQVHAVVPNTYSNYLYPYSFKSHAETLNRLTNEALSNPSNQVTVLGFSTGCIPVLVHYGMNKNHCKQNLNYILVNGYTSFYDLITKGFPIVGFILFLIHVIIPTIIFTVAQRIILSKLTILSITLISITAILVSSGVCIIALYSLAPKNIHAITQAKLINPIESIFERCKTILNPFRLNPNYAKTQFIALIIPNTVLCACLMLLTIPYILGLTAKQIVLHTGKPFIYLLLWIMNSNHNTVSLINKYSASLLSTPIRIFQSSEDNMLSKQIRIAPAVRHLGESVKITENVAEHPIYNNLDQYLRI
jgi:hypothetical protein